MFKIEIKIGNPKVDALSDWGRDISGGKVLLIYLILWSYQVIIDESQKIGKQNRETRLSNMKVENKNAIVGDAFVLWRKFETQECETIWQCNKFCKVLSNTFKALISWCAVSDQTHLFLTSLHFFTLNSRLLRLKTNRWILSRTCKSCIPWSAW